MNQIGIMQGRLSRPVGDTIQTFPIGTWAAEFELARLAGLDCIEWIFDHAGESANPLMTDEGLTELRQVIDRTGVEVRSLCADWFMDFPLLRCTGPERYQRLERLHWLLGRCQTLGLGRVVLPFVDVSAIRNADEMQQVAKLCQALVPALERHHVELHLETALAPQDFARLLEQIDHPLIWVNYDSGNSASLGYDVREEFSAYGVRIGSIHIKDRKRGAGTVPLGEGDAKLDALFGCIAERRFSRELIMQVARGEPGQELQLARANKAWILTRLEKWTSA